MEFLTNFLVTSIFALFLWHFRGFFVWFRTFIYHKWAVRNLPGPDQLPFIGSAHLIKGGLSGFPVFILRESEKMIAKGEGLMKVWMGPILRVYLFDPEAVKIITNSTVELQKAQDYNRLHPWLGSGLITNFGGDQWRTNRKLLTPAFHFGKLGEYSSIMDQHARELVTLLHTYTDGKEHNIYELIKCMSLDTIAETAMGIQLNTLRNPDQDYIKAVDTYNYYVFFRGAFPIYLNKWIWKLSGYEKLQNEALRVLKSTSSDVIKKRVQLLEQGFDEVKKRPDFLDILLVAQKEGRMSFEEMRQEVDSFLFAGYDTTSHTISWAIWCLATNPQVQQKLYDEITSKLNGDSEFATNATKDLPYFDAVIKEVLRMYPPIAGIGRQLQNDIQIGKYRIPKGANIMVSILALHHNSNSFKNHWTFDPENFLNDKEHPSNAYIPFSAGLRNCIGQKFAMREIRTVLAHLVYNFKFTSDHQMLDNKPLIKIVLTPTLGVPVYIEARN